MKLSPYVNNEHKSKGKLVLEETMLIVVVSFAFCQRSMNISSKPHISSEIQATNV